MYKTIRFEQLKDIKKIMTLVLLVIFCSGESRELPLPTHEKDVKKISGLILKCDFQSLGTWGFKTFMGITLDVPDSPYIRYNFPSGDREQYEAWCTDKAYVSIRYRAKSIELRPQISYWAQEIKKKKKPK